MLAGHDDVHIVPTLDAVVEAGKQAVGIGGQIHPHHVRLLVGHMVQEAGVLMGKAVVILLPDVGGQNIVQRGNIVPPGQLVAHFQPLGVLGEHGVHDADERLIAVEEAVAARQQVALQEALAEVLGEHGVHDPAIGVQVLVHIGDLFIQKAAAGDLKHRLQAVGSRLVRRENAEVPGVQVQLHHVPDVGAENIHILRLHRAGSLHVHSIVPEIWGAEIPQQQAAVGMWVRTHAAGPGRREGGDQFNRCAVLVEQLLRLVGTKPLLQFGQMLFRIRSHGNGHLMSPPAAFQNVTVHFLGAGPALGCPQDDHGPAGAAGVAAGTGIFLNTLDLTDGPVHRGGHLLMHLGRLAALHEARLPAAAPEEALHFLMAHAGEDGGVGDLEAVQVQDGQHRTVGNGVHELVAVPGGSQRAGLGLAITHHAGGDQAGVIRHSAEGVGQRIAQLAALMDGAGGLRCHMAGDTAGEGEPLEELFHAVLIPGDIGIDLGIAAVQPVLRHHSVAAVTGAGEVDHVQIIPLDDPVQMRIDEVLARAGTPVAHDGLFQVRGGQRPLQQGVIQQIELAGGEVIGCAPIRVDLLQLCRRQRRFFRNTGAAARICGELNRRCFLFCRHRRTSFNYILILVYPLFDTCQR